MSRPNRFDFRPVRWSLLASFALAWLPAGHAADAHRAVQAGPGDMVLLRNVPTRPADRAAPPGMALMVSPSPSTELASALGAEELSDADYARLNATPLPAAAHFTSGGVAAALDGTLLHGHGSEGAMASRGAGSTITGAAGLVGGATRDGGGQVQGALAQLPLAGH